MAVAAFVLHELRYLLAPAKGSEASEHGYIPLAAMLVVFLFALAAGDLAIRVAHARDDGTGEAEARPLPLVWLAASMGLVAIFAVQELTEATLAGAPVALPFAGGGLWALPLALSLGLVVAAGLRWASGAVLAAVRRRRPPRPRPHAPGRPPWRPLLPAGSLLGLNLAGRAPPLTS